MKKCALTKKVTFYNENGGHLGCVVSVIDTGSALSLLNGNLDLLQRVPIDPMDREIQVVGAFSTGPNFLGMTTLYIKIDDKLRPIRFMIVDKLNHACIIGNPDIISLEIVIKQGSCYTKNNDELGLPTKNGIRILNPDSVEEDKYISFFVEEEDVNKREDLTIVGKTGTPFGVSGSYMKLPAEEGLEHKDLKLYNTYEDFLEEDENLEKFCIPEIKQEDPKVLETFETMWAANTFNISTEVSDIQKAKIRRIITQYKQILSVGNSIGCVPPSIGVFKQKFNIDEPLPGSIYRPKTAEHCEVMHNELQKLAKLGVISKIKTDVVTTNMLVIPKPTNPPTMRVVLDMRRINKWVAKAEFPIPRIQDILRKLNMAKFYNCIDLSNAYFSIQVCRSQRHWYTILDPKTCEVWAFDRMPQGHKNAPPFFQRFIAQTLKPGLENCLEVYLDDCNTKSDTVDEATKILENIFDRCQTHNLRVNLKKLRVCCDQIACFGYIVSRKGLQANPDRIKALKEMRLPNESKKTLKTGVATLNYYRNLILNFAIHAKPLYDLTSDRTKFIWQDKHTNCWNKLVSNLCDSILLYNVDENLELYMMTDASNLGTGAVLYQWKDGQKRIIEIHSQGLVGSEALWAISHLELKAIYIGLSKFETYIGNRQINLVCDNTSVYFLLLSGIDKVAISRKTPSAKYLLFISYFNYTIRHTSGKDDSFLLADLASRLGKDCSGKFLTLGQTSKGPLITFEALEEKAKERDSNRKMGVQPEKIFSINIDKLVEKIQPEEQSSKILERLKLAQTDCKRVRKLISEKATGYVVQDGILYKQYPRGLCIVCPPFYTIKFLEQVHRHESARQLIQRINDFNVFLFNKYKNVQAFIENCSVCAPARSKPSQGIIDNTVQIPSIPMSTIHIDLWMIGTDTSVLIIVDSFSHFVDNRILKEPSTDEILRNLVFFMTTHGLPMVIVSDNGPQFTSEKFADFCSYFGVLHKRCAPGNSRGNSTAEFQISRTQTLLRIYQPPTNSEFGIYLAVITFLLNVQVRQKPKLSAFEILYGRTNLWIQQCPDLSKTKLDSMPVSLNRLYTSMRTARQAVIDRAMEKRQKLQPNNSRKERKIPVVGDTVRLKKFNFGRNYVKKFFRPYSEGLFKVKSKSPHTKLLLLEEIVEDPKIRPKQIMRHARSVRKVRTLTTKGVEEDEDPELEREPEIDEEEVVAKNQLKKVNTEPLNGEIKQSQNTVGKEVDKQSQRKKRNKQGRQNVHGMTLRKRK